MVFVPGATVNWKIPGMRIVYRCHAWHLMNVTQIREAGIQLSNTSTVQTHETSVPYIGINVAMFHFSIRHALSYATIGLSDVTLVEKSGVNLCWLYIWLYHVNLPHYAWIDTWSRGQFLSYSKGVSYIWNSKMLLGIIKKWTCLWERAVMLEYELCAKCAYLRNG